MIGSTHVVRPEAFINDMRVLELGGVGSVALPNGLHERRAETRPFQAYYDEKYYIKDPPPQVVTPAPSISSKSLKVQSSHSPIPSPATSSISLPKEDAKEKKKKGLFRF